MSINKAADRFTTGIFATLALLTVALIGVLVNAAFNIQVIA